MSADAVAIPQCVLWRDEIAGTSARVELRADYSDEQLSPGELEALCPVLPELMAELFAYQADERE
jgi:hypothetical protein